MREDQAPAGYRTGSVLSLGAAFVVFEVQSVVGDGFVCKRPRVGALESHANRQLEREAALLAALAGRGVPSIHARGDDERGPFLLMQRVPGAPLSRGDDDAARAAFEALACVHDAKDDRGPLGIVHGDLCPANILLQTARVWLVDFGHAFARDWPATVGGAFAGTLAFVAPEQARGEAWDARADLFAMAASIFSAALGAPPRPLGEPAVQLVRAGEEPLGDFRDAARAVVSPRVFRALAPCLEFQPDARPHSARAVLDEI